MTDDATDRRPEMRLERAPISASQAEEHGLEPGEGIWAVRLDLQGASLLCQSSGDDTADLERAHAEADLGRIEDAIDWSQGITPYISATPTAAPPPPAPEAAAPTGRQEPAPLRVVERNAERIEAALREVNGRARAHALTAYRDVVGMADDAERLLDRLGVQKSSRRGCRLTLDSGQRTANSYGYAVRRTRLVMQRGASAWEIVRVERGTKNTQPKSPRVHLTEAARASMIRSAVRDADVQLEEVTPS